MKNDVFRFLTIANSNDFEKEALATFHRQHKANPVYRSYCDLINISPSEIKSSTKIPSLPIQFFKSHAVKCFSEAPSIVFSSSGTTTSINAQHPILDKAIYNHSFQKGFENQYGDPKDWAILALLPSYLERKGSSLIYMMDALIQQSKHAASGFYLDEFDQLKKQLEQLESKQQPTILLGVSFALLDFAEQYPLQLKHTVVMETGGMKGRRKEMIREDLHATLTKAFGVEVIHSEYGMTELLSQAYSKGHGRFYTPSWMKITAGEINDPFALVNGSKIGRLNIIDLANQESCAFIATDDLGRVFPDGSFEVMGRLDQSDIRGCNLLVY
jgi:phenylacetate-coenzyme A ligase PaaK-like adenylate-forming protein